MDRDLHRIWELSCFQLNTPVSLSVVILLRHKEWAALASKRVLPNNYLDCMSGAERYRRDAQAVALFSKSPSLPTGIDRKAAAVETFYSCERMCMETNMRLSFVLEHPSGPADDAICKIVHRAKRWMSRMLGPLPLDLNGRMGPGTVFELKGHTFSTMADKLLSTPNVTPDAEATFRCMWEGSILERFRLERSLKYLEHCRGNRFTTVPKDGEKDRGCCIEPFGNLWCQLGIGSYFKERLAATGIYVHREKKENPGIIDPLLRLVSRTRPNGQQLHQRLAREASITGEWCTIDLSNASDTVAYAVVKALFPLLWFRLLDSVRSKATYIEKRWHHLEKFSSMGNGSTFEVETAVFCALIHGTTGLTPGRDFYVYGDDIIVPSAVSDDVLACLRFFGFTPNSRKTFTSGPFRESCGGDYFLGLDVRPFFFKKDTVRYPCEWFPLYNALMRRGLLLAAKHVLSQIPTHERFFGPDDGSDLFLVAPRKFWGCYSRIDQPHIVWVRGRALKPLTVPLDRWGFESIVPLAVMGAKSSGLHPANEIVGMKTVAISVS